MLKRILHARNFNLTQATVESTKIHLSRLILHHGFERALSAGNDKRRCAIDLLPVPNCRFPTPRRPQLGNVAESWERKMRHQH